MGHQRRHGGHAAACGRATPHTPRFSDRSLSLSSSSATSSASRALALSLTPRRPWARRNQVAGALHPTLGGGFLRHDAVGPPGRRTPGRRSLSVSLELARLAELVAGPLNRRSLDARATSVGGRDIVAAHADAPATRLGRTAAAARQAQAQLTRGGRHHRRRAARLRDTSPSKSGQRHKGKRLASQGKQKGHQEVP